MLSKIGKKSFVGSLLGFSIFGYFYKEKIKYDLFIDNFYKNPQKK